MALRDRMFLGGRRDVKADRTHNDARSRRSNPALKQFEKGKKKGKGKAEERGKGTEKRSNEEMRHPS